MARLTTLKPTIQTLRQPSYSRPGEDRIRGTTWQRLRDQVLTANPLCVHCQREGRIEPAREVDHTVPLHLGGSNGLANLAGLCRPHHALKTSAEQRDRLSGLDLDGHSARA